MFRGCGSGFSVQASNLRCHVEDVAPKVGGVKIGGLGFKGSGISSNNLIWCRL